MGRWHQSETLASHLRYSNTSRPDMYIHAFEDLRASRERLPHGSSIFQVRLARWCGRLYLDWHALPVLPIMVPISSKDFPLALKRSSVAWSSAPHRFILVAKMP